VPIREVLCSILLVVRRREVRSVRVCQAVARVIGEVGRRTGSWRMALDVCKIALDEMAGSVHDFLVNSRTTIVAIEGAFDNFAAASLADSMASAALPDLLSILRVDGLPALASEVPAGSGRRRRSGSRKNETPWPVEREDANAFFVTLHAYERVLSEVLLGSSDVQTVLDPGLVRRSLYKTVASILQDEESAGSYVDKKDALVRVARCTVAHSLGSCLTSDRPQDGVFEARGVSQ
jgi:hypothetical protein